MILSMLSEMPMTSDPVGKRKRGDGTRSADWGRSGVGKEAAGPFLSGAHKSQTPTRNSAQGFPKTNLDRLLQREDDGFGNQNAVLAIASGE